MAFLFQLAFAAIVALAAGREYNVTILENGVLVSERVTLLGGGLQKYEVPHHHDLQHVTVFLDFANDAMVMLYHGLKKCQVSTLPQSRPNHRDQVEGLRFATKYVYWVGQSQEKTYGRIESFDPLADISFLREEIQEACRDVPTYMTDLIEMDQERRDGESFMIKGSQALYTTLTKRRRRTDSFQCPITMFNQKCKIRNEERACYYFVLCPGVQASQQCVEHLRSGSIKCVPCCTHEDSPRDAGALFKHCDILNW